MKPRSDSPIPKVERPLNALQRELVKLLAEKAVEEFVSEKDFRANTTGGSDATH